MFARRPNPFFIGVLIGSLFHLMVMPWLSRTPAKAQSQELLWHDRASQTPPTLEYAGLNFVGADGNETLLYEHLVFSSSVFGLNFPEPRSFVTMDSLVVGVSQGLTSESDLYPGDKIPCTFDINGVMRDVGIHILDQQIVDPSTAFGLEPEEQRLLRSNGASGRILSTVVFTRSVAVPYLILSIESDQGSFFLPLKSLSSGEASAFAYSGAGAFYEIFADPLESDLVLLAAHDLGILTPADIYRTENVSELLSIPVEDRMDMQTLRQTQHLSKKCECDCDHNNMITVPPDIQSTDPTSDICTARAVAGEKYKDCLTAANIAMAGCIALVVAALAAIVIAACLLLSGPAAVVCLKQALTKILKLATTNLTKIAKVLAACGIAFGACRASCYFTLLSDYNRICLALCSGMPVNTYFDPFSDGCPGTLVP